jgi:iron complex outermembrane receptor protein
VCKHDRTTTSGWELSGPLEANNWLNLSAAYSILDGKFDSDGDGKLDSDMGAADIGPDRLNLRADFNPAGPFSGRLQSFTFFDENFQNNAGETTAEFDGYTTVDASVNWQQDLGQLTLAVRNLLDEDYITFFSQAANTWNNRFFAGQGRTLTLRWQARF